jgi:hypothetical protein
LQPQSRGRRLVRRPASELSFFQLTITVKVV